MEPTDIRREILWNIPGWAQTLMYALCLVALVVAIHGFRRRWRAWSAGLPTGEFPTMSAVLGRWWRHAILQARLWRVPMAGWSHAGIFWGFIVLFIGTCIVAVEDYGGWITGREPFLLYGWFYLVVSAALEVFGLAFIAGLIVALLRRRVDAKWRPLSRPIDYAVLWLLLIIALTGFVTEGVRIAGAAGGPDGIAFEKCSFVGWWLAAPLAGSDPNALRLAHLVLWIVHMVLSMGFIAALPYCKLRHLVITPLHVALTNPQRPGALAGVSLEEVEATERYGASSIGDFTSQQLRSFDACTECARCQNVCPAYATDKPLSPMQVVLDISRMAGWTTAAEGEDFKPRLHGDAITPEVLWSCTSCAACVQECPVMIDQLGAIIDMRRALVGEGEIRGSAQNALRSVGASGNPWGLPAEERMEWAADLSVPTLESEPQPEILFWVGCAGSFDRRSQKVSRAVVKILQHAGVRFAVLGKGECCTGDPARRLGDEFTFQEMANANIETLNAAGVERIVATCPHCFNSLKNEYPEYGGQYTVVHHSQLIAELLVAGALKLVPQGAGQKRTVVYHDACYLGRQNGEYDAPRRALAAAGLEVREPEAARERGFCCGAGGGRMWMEEDIGSRVNEERWRQLTESSPDRVAVACPFCMTMMRDAAAAKEDEVEVEDVAEVIASRLIDG